SQVGFVALGHARDLQVPDAPGGQVAAQLGGQVAFDDLAVVEVHLNLEVGQADHVQDAVRLVLAVQEEAGHVPLVDGFDEQVATGSRGLFGRPAQVVDV